MIKHTSIRDSLYHWQQEVPQKPAFFFLDQGETIDQTTTYAELYQGALDRAQALHQALKGQYQKPVLMLYPPGMEFIMAFLACQLSRTIAVPIFPPRSSRHLDRLVNVVLDSGATTVLTVAEEQGKIEEWIAKFGASFIQVIATDTLEPISEEVALELPRSEDVSFIQYTSGSTGRPKGVTITNENLMANELMIQKMSQLSPEDVLLNWLPFYHDMGLIGNILFNIYNGSTCYLMMPFDFIRKPVRWFRAISKYGVTVSGGPNFAYDLCVEKVEPTELNGVDLSRWKVAFNGSEPIRPETLEQFSAKFAPWGFQSEAFLPCYGMAEATLFVSGGGRKGFHIVDTKTWAAQSGERGFESGSIERIVASGKIWWDDIDVQIVDPDTQAVCPAGRIGEVWISGKSVTKGYWRAEKPVLQSLNGRDYLPTGDLGTIHNNELFITGRIKEMIIIRGQNFYPYDIEKIVAQAHPAVNNNGVAAFAIEQDQEEKLILMIELKRDYLQDHDAEDIFRAVQKAVSNFLNIRAYDMLLLKPFEILRTSSGKIMRVKCRKKYLKGDFSEYPSKRQLMEREATEADTVPAGREALQNLLATAVEQLIGEAPPADWTTAPLIDLGLDSLHLVSLSNTLFEAYGVEVDVGLLFEGATLADLEKALFRDDHQSDAAEAQVPEPGALSANQKSLWYLDHIHPEQENNVGLFLEVRGPFQLADWTTALAQLIDRHASLRTSFHDRQGQLLGVVAEAAGAVEVVSLPPLAPERLEVELLAAFNAPLALDRSPALRLIVAERAPDHHAVALVTHHLHADGWSLVILLRELATLLRGAVLNAPPPSYATFVAAEKAALQGPDFARALRYYQNLFELDFQQARFLQSSYPHRANSGQGVLRFPMDRGPVQQLATELGVSPFLLLLGIYHWLLSIYHHTDTVVSASPVARREAGRWARTVGYFSNLQYLRSTVDHEGSFRDLVLALQAQFRESYAWQALPYARLVERVFDRQEVEKRNLLHQFLFTYQSLRAFPEYQKLYGEAGLDCGAMNWRSLDLPQQRNVFQLSLEVFDDGRQLWAYLKFQNPAAEGILTEFWENFQQLLQHLPQRVDEPLRTVRRLAPAQEERVLAWSRGSARSAPTSSHIVPAFEQSVRQHAERPALRFEGTSWTYEHLNRQANQLAHYLRERGELEPEDLVGLRLEPSPWLIASLWAILKCGAAYVPIDPNYPADRQQWLAEDARCKLVIDAALLETFQAQTEAYATDNLELDLRGDQLAYVLYTSGTTGRPKGVLIEHHSLLDYSQTVVDHFALRAEDRVIQQSSISFDTMVEEVFPTLLVGGELLLLRHGGKDLEALLHGIESEGATVLSTTPLVLDALNQKLTSPHQLRLLISGGDQLEDRHLTKFLDWELPVYNTYGPTETTVCATYGKVDSAASARSIGRPITNKSVYLLARDGQLAPPGVEGELYIGGSGLARAYWQRPELTAKRFVVHPEPKGRVYRSGDIGRWWPSGEIEFLGRVDHQVKIRGHRIELAEIEYVLSAHPALSNALAVAAPLAGKGKVLVAYYLPRAEVSPSDLRQFLQSQLPSYMVPSYFLPIEQLPLSANGKIDRKVLVLPEELALLRQQNYVAPTNEVEEKLVAIWSEVLQLDPQQIGTQDDFFELGGESLLLMKVRNAVENHFGVKVEIATFLRAFNIQAIAAYLDSVQWLLAGDTETSNPENEIIEI
ncbi:MAG: amino acid adenylation domain-containing protein [Bacteroidota bacterium]